MLKRILYASGAVVLVVGIGLGWMVWRTQALSEELVAARVAQVQPIVDALARGEEPNADLLRSLASNVLTRVSLYRALERAKRTDLFPAEQKNQRALAEGKLTEWLVHPNELDAVPAVMELTEEVPVDGKGLYYLFRFQPPPSHWRAEKGWLAGISGPYTAGAPLTTEAGDTFSTFAQYDSAKPAELVRRALEERGGVTVTNVNAKP